LNLFSNKKKVELKNATPAQILQKILLDSWTLSPEDKDMIVMYHKFGYELEGKKHQIDATMVCSGEDQTFTAMAKTVGLPVGIAALAILNNKIQTYGVQIPTKKEFYEPILNELKEFGVIFNEKEEKYFGYNSLNI
jgi:saccharopine dehydrogenase-like NADP-dependent oxidoreductase